MNKRYVLTADEAQAADLIDTLRTEIDDERIAVLARNDAIAARLGAEQASYEETREGGAAVARGTMVGAATGLVAGIAAVVASGGLILGGAGIALATGAGASVGMLAGSMLGLSEKNPIVAEAAEAIDKGAVLVTYSVDDERAAAVDEAVRSAHPDLDIQIRELTGVASPSDDT